MKGFTLLEILVTVLISTFIIAGMYGVLNLTKANYNANLVSLNLQRQARQGMSRLSREIRQASLDSIQNKTQNRASITFNTSVANDITYSLYSDQHQLRRNNLGIANDITNLTFFQIDGNSNIQKITLQARKIFRSFGKDRTLTFSLTEQVQVRNP